MRFRVGAYRRPIVVAAAFVAVFVGVGQTPALAGVSAVKGSAYGYYLSVGLFGGPPTTRGPAPAVTLAPDGSNSPQTATQPSATATVGPAVFFESDQLDVSTQGRVGPSGSVTTSTNIANVTTDSGEVFGAANVASTCTAAGSVSGSTTITGGTLTTDSGDDQNSDGDFTDAGEHAPVTVSITANPAPNAAPIPGHIHVSGSQDNFTYAFNEQVTNPDGSLTVYAGHERLTGPTAVGDLFIGKAECGLTGAPDPQPPASVSPGPAPPLAPQGPPPFQPLDSTPPAAKLSGRRSQKLGKSVAVSVSCTSEPCIARARGTIKVPRVGGARAKAYKTKKITKPVVRGATVKIKLGLSKAARTATKRALRRGKRLTMKLTIAVTDAAGNPRKLTRRVKLRL